MEDHEPVDAVVVDDPPATEDPPAPSVELVHAPVPGHSTALIAAESAREKLTIAQEIATTLNDVITQQGLRTKMGRRKKTHPDGREEWIDSYHVNVEGWQTLATFLDLAVVPLEPTPVIDPATGRARLTEYEVERIFYPRGTKRDAIRNGSADVERVERATVSGYDWRCRTEVFKDGTLIAAATAIVSRAEESWRDRDDHALASMAQTRSIGKAIAGAARWITALAGYSSTPAEEMPPTPDAGDTSAGPQTGQEAPVWAREATDDRKRELLASLEALFGSRDNAKAFAVNVKDTLGIVPEVVVMTAKGIRTWANVAAPAEPPATTPDAPADDVPDTPVDERPPAGSVHIPPQSSAEHVTEYDKRLREAGCICSNPVGGPYADDCPISGHGIPF